MAKKPELSILEFSSEKSWTTWLVKHHESSAGIWIKLFKKDSGIKSVTYAEALNVALRFGWIDGQKKGFDTSVWLQKFTPRTKKSIWSKVNTEHIEKLIAEGKMMPAGMKAVEEAKADGRWDRAYSAASKMVIPEDFMKALKKNKKAEAFFKTLNKTNLFSIGFRLETAKKEETRLKRMNMILEMLAKGEKFH